VIRRIVHTVEIRILPSLRFLQMRYDVFNY